MITVIISQFGKTTNECLILKLKHCNCTDISIQLVNTEIQIVVLCIFNW